MAISLIGSAALTPNIAFAGTTVTQNLNSGAANTLVIGANNATAITVDTFENVGVGTSTMTRVMNVGGSTSTVGISIQNSGTGGNNYSIFSTSSGATAGTGKLAIFNDTTSTHAVVLDSSGNLGIGTTAPQAPLQIAYTTGTPNAALITTDAFIVTAQNTAPGFSFVVASNSSTQRGVFKGTRARGTLESPTVPLVNDNTFSLLGAIYDGSVTTATAAINMDVDGTVSAGVAPQRISFWTGTASSRVERMRIDGSGNIGIGTTAATGKLDVRGSVYVSSTASGTAPANGGTLGVSDSGLWIGTNASAPIEFAINGTEKMRIDSSGNIQIGTTVQQGKLSVAGSIFAGVNSTTAGAFYSFSAANDTRAGFINDGTQLQIAMTYLTTGGYKPITFATGDYERMRIDSSGNLFVGATTNTNGANFQVSVGSGASSSPYAAVFNTASSPTVSASTRLDLGFLGGTSNYVPTGLSLGTLYFMGQANDAGYAGAFVTSQVISGGNVARASGHSIDLVFGTKSSASSGAVERMRIDSNGSVMIGATNNHAYKGSVNIVATPGYGCGYSFSDGTATMRGSLWWQTTVGSVGVSLYNFDNTNLMFGTNATERVRIDVSGNVGIGTTSPAAKLHAVGGGSQQLQVEGIEADIWMKSTGPNGTWRIMGSTGTNTHQFRIYDHTNSADRVLVESDGRFKFNSGYGSAATAYGCRAWVNWNGVGTTATNMTVRGNGNVSSVYKNNTGYYTVNFATAMPDANYGMSSLCSAVSTDAHNNYIAGIRGNLYTSPSTTSCPICVTNGGSATQVDVPLISVSFHR